MNPFYVTCSDRLAGSAASAGCDPPQGSKPSPARATRSKRQRSRTCHRAWLPVQAAYAGQSLVTIRRTPHGADDRQATQSSPPSPRSDPTVQRQAYRTRLFRHACDVASASPAAIAFREVGTVHSVRPTLSGQSLRFAGHGCLCWLRMPVSPLSRSGARRTVPMTDRPRKAARPLPAPIPTRDAKRTAPGSSGTPATSPPHHVLLSPSVRWALRAASTSFGFHLLVAATLAMSGWLDPLRVSRDLQSLC